MRKTLLILLLCILSTFSFAQNYHPLLEATNNWHMVPNGMVVRPPASLQSACTYPDIMSSYMETDFRTGTDTSINGQIYKPVLITQSGDCTFGYIREDSIAKKVYFIDNVFPPEFLLYDFSLNVGDSLPLSFNGWGGYFQSGNFTLDSITILTLNIGDRQVFHLSNHSNGSWGPDLVWVEGVGCLQHPFYPFSENLTGNAVLGCNISVTWFGTMLACFDHDYKAYYDSCAMAEARVNHCVWYQDTCSYYNICGAIPEIENISSFVISPNPSAAQSTSLQFELSKPCAIEFDILSAEGKLVQKVTDKQNYTIGKHALEITLTGLSKGIYFVHGKAESGINFQKLVIQ